MKRNYMLRIALAVFVCCAVTLCLLPSTLARYTQSIPAAATVRAGLFRVLANDTNFEAASVTTIATPANFGTLLQPGTGTWGPELNVSPADGTIIAPGTAGYFQIQFENQSEVPVRFWFITDPVATLGRGERSGFFTDGIIPATGAPQLEFASARNGTWGDSVLNVLRAINGSTQTNIILQPGESSDEFTVYWRWPFNTDIASVTRNTNLGRYAHTQVGDDIPGLAMYFVFAAEQVAAP